MNASIPILLKYKGKPYRKGEKKSSKESLLSLLHKVIKCQYRFNIKIKMSKNNNLY